MGEAEFLKLCKRKLPALKKEYGLEGWTIEVKVVDAKELTSPDHIAEIQDGASFESSRYSQIKFSRQAVTEMGIKKLEVVLEHEVQHVALYPLDALEALVLSSVGEEVGQMLKHEFARTHERLRALVGQLTGRGNHLE